MPVCPDQPWIKVATFQCLICGIRTYVELGNTEVGLHRAQLPGFIFKEHSQLLQASSAGVQREMTRGWLLSNEDSLPFNLLKMKWAGKNSSRKSRSAEEVRGSECDECQSGPLPDKVNTSSLVPNVYIKVEHYKSPSLISKEHSGSSREHELVS